MRRRQVLSVVGRVDVPRRYFACECGQGVTPMDAWAGLGPRTVSDEVRRLIVLAGSTWSFDQASAKLKGPCRLNVSNDTIRAVVIGLGSQGLPLSVRRLRL